MKKINVFFSLMVLWASNLSAQSYTSSTISYSYIEIIKYSENFGYSTDGAYKLYTPNYDFLGNVYAVAQARTDYNYARISMEYKKLKNLELINSVNKATLANYKAKQLSFVEDAYKTWNFGGTGAGTSNTEKLLQYLSQVYQVNSIKQEINLLKSINREINRLRSVDPNGFYKSERYKELDTVLKQLETIESTKIGQLAWNYGLTL